MKSPLIFIALAGALGPLPTLASPPLEAATRAVSYADLDLGTAAGRRALDRRIGIAIRDVCGQASDADPAGRNAVRKCRVDLARQLAPRRDAAIAAAVITQVASRAD